MLWPDLAAWEEPQHSSKREGCHMKLDTTIASLITLLVFALPTSGQGLKLKVLHNFGSSDDGNVPSGPLLLDPHGNLYGVTGGGPGTSGNGVVFDLIPQSDGSWHENILHSLEHTATEHTLLGGCS